MRKCGAHTATSLLTDGNNICYTRSCQQVEEQAGSGITMNHFATDSLNYYYYYNPLKWCGKPTQLQSFWDIDHRMSSCGLVSEKTTWQKPQPGLILAIFSTWTFPLLKHDDIMLTVLLLEIFIVHSCCEPGHEVHFVGGHLDTHFILCFENCIYIAVVVETLQGISLTPCAFNHGTSTIPISLTCWLSAAMFFFKSTTNNNNELTILVLITVS